MAEDAPDIAPSGGRNPFASPLFVRWWLASLVAGTGVGTQAITVPLYIRDRVDDEVRAIAIAGALIAQTAPGAILALVGGAIADRVERRRILVRTYAVAAGVSVAYVVLSGMDVRVVWPVFGLAAIVGSAAAFTNPARQSMLPMLVSRSQLQNGVIFGNISYLATFQFMGPMAAGLIVDARGLSEAFSLEVVLLMAAALIFSRIETPPAESSGRSVLSDLAEGLRYARGERAILGLLLLGTVPGVWFIGPFAVTIPLIVPDVFGESDKWVGILTGCFGSGVVLGSLALTVRTLPRRGLAVCVSTLAGGLILICYGFSHTLWLSALLLVFWGLGASIFINYVIALLQEHTEPAMMGRVMSMYSLAFFIANPLGYAQAGAVTSVFGIQAALVSSGVVAASIGIASLLFLRRVHELH